MGLTETHEGHIPTPSTMSVPKDPIQPNEASNTGQVEKVLPPNPDKHFMENTKQVQTTRRFRLG
jgi:hypothetical protein